jgi:N-acetylmuramoyl-L-alanine amidase
MKYSRRVALKLGMTLSASVILTPPKVIAQAADQQFEADVGLDPGHSHVDVGSAGAGVGEYQHTLDVAFRVKPLLEAAGLTVNLSRTNHEPLSAMSNPDSTERTRIEQLARIQAVGQVRIYVSIHFNAGPTGDPRLNGTETYYNPDNVGYESLRLANALQQNVLGSLWDYGYPAFDRGVKDDLSAGKPYGHFFSMRGGMPSALVEGLFLSNPTESRLLLRDDARQAIAEGYAGGILNYFSTTPLSVASMAGAR